MGAPLELLLSSEDIAEIAASLRIRQHEGGHQGTWIVNQEQLAYWRARDTHGWVFVAKPRQIGLSTAVCLEDVLWTQAADADGQVVKCAIVVDKDKHAIERLKCCADFAQQLGFVEERDCTDYTITFPGGSTIIALSAGGHNVGRSVDAQRFHLTELPNWPDPATNYTDLTQALSLGCDIIVETTINNDDMFTSTLWDTENDFHKVFFGLEEHDEYREDPARISDARWLELQDIDAETGKPRRYTNRAAAAWFDWAIINKCAGDEIRANREYPQREEDMFTSAAGRWIRVDPIVEDPKVRDADHFAGAREWPRILKVQGIAGDVWHVHVWQELAETSKQLAFWVDVSEGREISHSAIAGTDRRDGSLVVSFNAGDIQGDDLARVLLAVLDAFTDRRELMGIEQPEKRPLVRIEAQGVNQTCVQQARRLGIAFEAYTMTEERRNDQLLEVRRALEGGMIPRGPRRLAYEARNLTRDEHGRWKGPKDFLMCLGGTLVMRRENPFKNDLARPLIADRDRAVSKRRLRQERKRLGRR